MKVWKARASFLARYLGLPESNGDPQEYTQSLAQLIIRWEPGLAPYVLQVMMED